MSRRLGVTQRIVVNYYTAKRMLQALHLAVQRHEAAFGVIDTDIQRRMGRAAGSASVPNAADTGDSATSPQAPGVASRKKAG